MSRRDDIQWNTIAIESVAIVISILLAFAIDAWWADHQDRKSEVKLLQSLRTEFAANLEVIPRHIGYEQDSFNAAQAMIDSIREALPDDTFLAPDYLIVASTVHGSFDAVSGIYDAAQQSGDIRLIENMELRENLATWPGLVQDAVENQQIKRTIWGPKLLSEMMLQVDMSEVRRVIESCGYGQLESCASQDFTMQPSLELLGMLTEIRDWSREATAELEQTRKFAEKTVALIDSELERLGN